MNGHARLNHAFRYLFVESVMSWVSFDEQEMPKLCLDRSRDLRASSNLKVRRQGDSYKFTSKINFCEIEPYRYYSTFGLHVKKFVILVIDKFYLAGE